MEDKIHPFAGTYTSFPSSSASIWFKISSQRIEIVHFIDVVSVLLPPAFPDEAPVLPAAPLFAAAFPFPVSDVFPPCEEPVCDGLPPVCVTEAFPADVSDFWSVSVWFCALPGSFCAVSPASAAPSAIFCSSSR